MLAIEWAGAGACMFDALRLVQFSTLVAIDCHFWPLRCLSYDHYPIVTFDPVSIRLWTALRPSYLWFDQLLAANNNSQKHPNIAWHSEILMMPTTNYLSYVVMLTTIFGAKATHFIFIIRTKLLFSIAVFHIWKHIRNYVIVDILSSMKIIRQTHKHTHTKSGIEMRIFLQRSMLCLSRLPMKWWNRNDKSDSTHRAIIVNFECNFIYYGKSIDCHWMLSNRICNGNCIGRTSFANQWHTFGKYLGFNPNYVITLNSMQCI